MINLKRYHLSGNLYVDEFGRIHELHVENGVIKWVFTGEYLPEVPKDFKFNEFYSGNRV